MSGLIAVLLLQVAVAPGPSISVSQELVPGDQYYWQTPCEIVKPDETNRIEYLATNYLKLARDPRRVVRCVQPEGGATPSLLSALLGDDRFFIVYSQELDDPTLVSDLAIKGMIAHEVAHVSLDEGCKGPFYHPYTHQQRVECESRIDREAARMAGPGAVEAALREYHRLHVHMIAESLARVRKDLLDERLTRLKQEVGK